LLTYGGVGLDIPENHPRYRSLIIRNALVEGLDEGLVGKAGLIAHGRGEAFDYIFGEVSNQFALDAIKASAASLLLARHPVISVNGNVAALVLKETVQLSKVIPADIEVNLFYWSRNREIKIVRAFERECPECIVHTQGKEKLIQGLASERSRVSKEGILDADVVLVPLEDGDRIEQLKKCNKKAIAVDLNPFSRTARKADITIVDNVVRAFPALIEEIKRLRGSPRTRLKELSNFDNMRNLEKAVESLRELSIK